MGSLDGRRAGLVRRGWLRSLCLLSALLPAMIAGCRSSSLSAVSDAPKDGPREWSTNSAAVGGPLLLPPLGPITGAARSVGRSVVPAFQKVVREEGAPGSRPATPVGVGSASDGAPPARSVEAVPTEETILREPWTWGESSGVVLRSRHYEIHTTIRDESLLRELPLLMEGALVQYRNALVELPPPPRPMRSTIFDRRNEWAAYTRRKLPQEADLYLGIGRGGFTTGGESVLFNLGRSDTFIIAVHEGWHQYTQTTFKDRLPTWLEEGMACWMEGHRFHRQSRPVFAPWRNMERYGALREAVREDRLVPLAGLLKGTPQEALGEGRSTLLGYYAQVWALVHFLHDGEEGRYREALRRLVRDAAHGEMIRTMMASESIPPEAKRPWALVRHGRWAAMAYFNRDLDELEAQYMAFVRHAVADGGGNRVWRGLSPITGQ